MMTPEELEDYNNSFPHDDDDEGDPGDWDDDMVSDCCHPGHPSNYGDS